MTLLTTLILTTLSTSTPVAAPLLPVAPCQSAQCQCQERELIRRTPRSTLTPIFAQPPSDERRAAFERALLNTALRDHAAITRVCGPVLHPETAAPT